MPGPHVSPILLHLRPGVREEFLPWLAETHPDLVERYEELYRKPYAPAAERDALGRRVSGLIRSLAQRGPAPALPARFSRGSRGDRGTGGGAAHARSARHRLPWRSDARTGPILELQDLDTAIDRLEHRREQLEAGESSPPPARWRADARLGELRLASDSISSESTGLEHEIASMSDKLHGETHVRRLDRQREGA